MPHFILWQHFLLQYPSDGYGSALLQICSRMCKYAWNDEIGVSRNPTNKHHLSCFYLVATPFSMYIYKFSRNIWVALLMCIIIQWCWYMKNLLPVREIWGSVFLYYSAQYFCYLSSSCIFDIEKYGHITLQVASNFILVFFETRPPVAANCQVQRVRYGGGGWSVFVIPLTKASNAESVFM